MRQLFYQRRSTGTAGLKTHGLWFFYRGDPIYLMGAGTESLYPGGLAAAPPGTREEDVRAVWTKYLDLLSEYGINFVRFLPWAFCWDAHALQWACPYPIVSVPAAPVRYDLTRHHEPFFDTLGWLCRETHRRDIFLSVVLFDDCSLSRGGAWGGPWTRHPMSMLCGGACAHPADFYDVSEGDNRALQEGFARRVFAAGDFSNVLYEVMGEVGASVTGTDAPVGAWLHHHLNWARQQAPGHLLGISGSSWSEDGGSAEELWEEEGVDVLLPHEIDGRAALSREETAHQFRFYSRRNIEKPRIVGEVAFGGAVADDDERKHLWIALTNGGHTVPACRQPFSVTPIWWFCRALSEFLRHSGIHWWDMEPLEGLLLPEPGRAYVIGSRSRGEYLLYFWERPVGEVAFTVPGSSSAHKLTWVDPVSCKVISEPSYSPPTPLAFPAGTADMALWVRPQSP